MKTSLINWLRAARLRTLPLALSSIFLGSFLAYAYNKFSWEVFFLAILTTLFLQILSNLANDYGDAVSGVDNDSRIGPARAVQSGAISKKQMRNAIIVFVLLSFVSGSWLVAEGTRGLDMDFFVFFICLGIVAILAAIKYTVGKNPYGYIGLGDVFVFIFFGITGVGGTFFLHTHELQPDILLPAASVGFLSAGVLNLNNMRDLAEDSKAGKITLAVRLGIKHAKTYHILLISSAVICSIVFTLSNYLSPFQFLFALSFPLLFMNIRTVVTNTNPVLLDLQLKKLAVSTLLFVLTFGIGLLMS